ncbi:uncharacterized protein LOC100209924 [Hydra vulgaris]|uniref:Uncharacterized protein LOC100209924 n=1 Tax=Hydra vulgaris TaxID=6087 RepID=A0ABM4CW95_HYDVU
MTIEIPSFESVSNKEDVFVSPLPELCVMIKGSTMLKAGRMGRPHFRKFHMSADLKLLQWESPNKGAAESSVAIGDIEEVITGQKTKIFEGNPIPEYEAISFSVIYKQGNTKRSLDIVCKDRVEYDIWTVGLQALINGFDNLDGLRLMSEADLSKADGKLMLELGLFGDRVSVKEDACDIYTWGASPKGVLGHGEETEELFPRVVEALLGRDIRTVACGTEHTLAVSVNGEMFSWGCGRGGKLGLKNILDRYMPLKIGAFENVNITFVSCNELHSASVTESGELYTFGRSGPHLGYTTEDRKQAVPRKVDLSTANKIKAVSCGLEFTIALNSEGELYSFGKNDCGQLGAGHFNDIEEPYLIKHLNGVRISKVSCGSKHVGAVTVNGDVWLWGSNEFGQLGRDKLEAHDIPFEAPSTFWNEEIQDIKCGGSHTVVLSCTGVLYVFGNGQSGQLGVAVNQTSPYITNPCILSMPNNTKVAKVDCGIEHTAAVTESGCLYTWGNGSRGRLGHGDHQDRYVPTLVESLAYKQVQSIACGAYHTAACVIRAWVHDQETKSCMACKQRFTTVRRRHHCRKCGGIFCGTCSQRKCPLLEIGYSEPVRVCDRCYFILTESTL